MAGENGRQVQVLPPRAAIALLTLQLRGIEQEIATVEERAAACNVEAELALVRGRLAPLVEERRAALDAEIDDARREAAAAVAAAHAEPAFARRYVEPTVVVENVVAEKLVGDHVVDEIVVFDDVALEAEPSSDVGHEGGIDATAVFDPGSGPELIAAGGLFVATDTGADTEWVAEAVPAVSDDTPEVAAIIEAATSPVADATRIDDSISEDDVDVESAGADEVAAFVDSTLMLPVEPTTSLPPIVEATPVVARPMSLNDWPAPSETPPPPPPHLPTSSTVVIDADSFARAFAAAMAPILEARMQQNPEPYYRVVPQPAPAKRSFWSHAWHPDVLLSLVAMIIVLVVLVAWTG